MNAYPIFIGNESLEELRQWLSRRSYSKIMVLMDAHTELDCYPILSPFLPSHIVFSVAPGELHKNLRTCEAIWEVLTAHQFDRKGLVINLGGGVLGDMGGFAAATYKRGLDFVQIPTTLLSQVDASVGGKLGIDFQGFKNHIGLFQEPQAVVIWPPFLETLPFEELRSGFAEVIKHHLIADATGWETLAQQKKLEQMNWEALIRHSVQIKSTIVESDFKEQGARKALNFGHTIGHAIETHRLGTAGHLLHGEAIAIGMVAEAYVSYQQGLFSESSLDLISQYILTHFPKVSIEASELPAILQNMYQDKKNVGGEVRCTLVEGPGRYRVDYVLGEEEAKRGIAYYLGMTGLD
jgi:3-dehydroquinate synthase